jgi:nucleoside-diphosphate-sugar epimerase
MANIIVMGGSGYIGQEVIRAALNTGDVCYQGGHKVINIDLQPPPALHPRLRQISDYFDVNHHPNVKFIQADLSDPRQVSQAINEAQDWAGEIQYLANLVGKVRFDQTYDQLYQPNVKTAENIARECATRGFFLIFLSGTAVHGNVLRGKVMENDPFHPVGSYGRTKAEAEKAIFKEVIERGLQAIIFRSIVPTGPGVQLSPLNNLYEAIMNEPILPAVKGSLVTWGSTEDISRAFIFAIENVPTVFPPEAKVLSDIVYNIGVNEPCTDSEVAAYLQKIVLGAVKKPIVELPVGVVIFFAYASTFATRLQNVFRRQKMTPRIHQEQANLMRGSQYQDMTKFKRVFEANGFALKHDTAEKVLNTGAVYKFLTDWVERPKPDEITELIQDYLEERTILSYQ